MVDKEGLKFLKDYNLHSKEYHKQNWFNEQISNIIHIPGHMMVSNSKLIDREI